MRTIKNEKAKPNWREPKDYEFTKTLNSEGWAWEFLRRNPDYIREWEKALPAELERIKMLLSDPETKKAPYLEAHRTNTPESCAFVIPGKSLNKYFKKWGILNLVNPEQDRPFPNPFHQFMSFEHGTVKGGNIGWLRSDDIHSAYIPVIFDMTHSIKSQISNAQKRLLEWQRDFKHGKKEVRETIDWKDYLRILDAKAENIKNNVIAKMLFPYLSNTHPDYQRNDRFRKALKRAKFLSSKGYKEIAMKN